MKSKKLFYIPKAQVKSKPQKSKKKEEVCFILFIQPSFFVSAFKSKWKTNTTVYVRK